jgi:trigger factor
VAGIRTRGFGVIIGSKTLLPGFEEALVGMKRSDEKKFELTFPKDYHAEHLREKPVTFHTTVTKVEEVTVPVFDDEFAKKHGLGESAPAVRERIGASLKEQELSADRERRERELFEAIRKATKVDLAPELIEETERGLFLEFEEQLQRRNVSLEDWLKQSRKKPEDLGKEMHEQAEKRLQLRFGVEQLLADRTIEVSDEDIQREIKAALAGAEPAEKEKAAARFQKGTEDYEQLVWRKKVERLVEQMLAA